MTPKRIVTPPLPPAAVRPRASAAAAIVASGPSPSPGRAAVVTMIGRSMPAACRSRTRRAIASAPSGASRSTDSSEISSTARFLSPACHAASTSGRFGIERANESRWVETLAYCIT